MVLNPPSRSDNVRYLLKIINKLGYNFHDEETVRTTRQSYQHLIEMLRRAPID